MTISKHSRLYAAMALALSSTVSYAQVVLPPTMAGEQPPAVMVTPPQGVSSAVPGASAPGGAAPSDAVSVAGTQAPPSTGAAPQASLPVVSAPPATPANLVDIALPAAPAKVESKAPAVAKLPPPPEKPVKATSVKVSEDPYAAIVGTPVSDSQLNRFVFPEPVEGVYFAEGAPLPECPADAHAQDPCKPVFLNNRRMMLLQLRAGAKGPIQMLVHLHSGEMVTLNLMPAAGPGAVVRINGAEDGASDARLAGSRAQAEKFAASQNSMHATEQGVELLASFARGEIPQGFDSLAPGAPIRFEYFDVVPMAAWSNGAGQYVHLMQVKAFGEQPVAINASLFRTPNVRALALDRDTITEKAPALLYMLEFRAEEAY